MENINLNNLKDEVGILKNELITLITEVEAAFKNYGNDIQIQTVEEKLNLLKVSLKTLTLDLGIESFFKTKVNLQKLKLMIFSLEFIASDKASPETPHQNSTCHMINIR
ncbi:hypothetical protein PM10SUCC1_29120 [Propionigenium maris DSM 9537]|uniref:Uncharacterized protein n=1 Tax=Propionigenium maris DSM 9537 TaxID=1123000 RepID=A0A9W6GLP9_9FUSO|nr:hypothetical protein [Propionigenium maris]GLI57398.1 hypothetical protein PM10SUCC1_29120 [Propionigenium maris DSM 9537]